MMAPAITDVRSRSGGARPRRWLPATLAVLVACVGSPAGVRADVVVLTTGERIRGAVTRTTDTEIVIEVGGREHRVKHSLVQQIQFDPAPAPPATRGAAPRVEVAPPAERSVPERSGAPAIAPPAPEAQPTAEAAGSADPGSAKAETLETAAVAPTPPPPVPRPSIDLASVSPVPLRDALQALLRLRDDAADGVSHAQYMTELKEAQARVERYVGDAADRRAEVKRALAAATRLFVLAGTAWGVFDAKGDLGAVGRSPAVAECPRLQRSIERDAERWRFKPDDPAFAGLMAGSEGLADLWACAADRIDDAARLIGTSRAP